MKKIHFGDGIALESISGESITYRAKKIEAKGFGLYVERADYYPYRSMFLCFDENPNLLNIIPLELGLFINKSFTHFWLIDISPPGNNFDTQQSKGGIEIVIFEEKNEISYDRRDVSFGYVQIVAGNNQRIYGEISGIYVESFGDVVAGFFQYDVTDGLRQIDTVTIADIPAGTFLPICPVEIYSGSTAKVTLFQKTNHYYV